MTNDGTRDAWGSRLGLILAAAGNAIGIGNLLRFPGKAAQNGGGAFMIPYVTCLLLFGLPMMWVAWSIGRHGGRYGHGSLPGMFHRIWRSPAAKYLGVLGLALPLCFVLYYAYIEAWCLGYAVFSFQGDYFSTADRHVDMAAYFNQFLGDAASQVYFPGGLKAAFAFMGITLVLNLFVLSRGVARGIEVLAKVAIPLLFLFCVLLAVRVFTISGKGSAFDGLNFLWTPDLSKLSDGGVWLEAAGQIFFTLSIGFGALECYASYVREDDDIALTGLTTASTNEFVEVIFGSMLAIPAIAVFYGAAHLETASYGTFALGMISLPEILRTFPMPALFGGIWFLLLFFAAFTSSVAVAQPVMAFFQDELRATRAKSTVLLGGLWIVGLVPVVLFTRYGFVDELDFWAGTFGLALVALIEAVLFAWVWGIERGWAELHSGAMIRVPSIFKVVIKYVTPLAMAYVLLNADKVAGFSIHPTPKYDVTLAQPDQLSGRLTTTPPDQLDLASADFVADFEKSVKDRAREAGDGQVWMTVDFDGQGGVQVSEIETRDSLTSFGNPARWTEYFQAQGLEYVEGEAEAQARVPVRATLVARVLDKAPYVWGARGLILAYFAVFLVLIGVAFSGREPLEEVQA